MVILGQSYELFKELHMTKAGITRLLMWYGERKNVKKGRMITECYKGLIIHIYQINNHFHHSFFFIMSTLRNH